MSASTQHQGRLNEGGRSRDEQIQNILDEVRAKRSAGQQVLDEEVIVTHADLLPELVGALGLLKKIHTSFRGIAPGEGGSASEENLLGQWPEPRAFDSAVPTIAGYRLLRPIDRGGQAVVFLAIQQSTKRNVAVKVLTGGAFITHRKQNRFEREVKALAVLEHPGIVRIVDRGRTTDGSFFIAMDYVEGEELDAYLERRRGEGWRARQVVELFVKIAGALGEAHRQGVIHRDIKPSNIRIDPWDEPRILDFGLARLTSATDDEHIRFTVTQTGGVVGSLPWASPEQASGDSQKICPGSDVYSLGVMLYRALVGCSPYDLTGTLREQMHNICEAAPTFPAKPKSLLPFGRVDPLLADVILKCLEKNPARRYDNAAALGAELKKYLAGTLRKSPVQVWGRRFIWAMTLITISLGGAAAWTVESTRIVKPIFWVTKLPTIRNSIGMQLILLPPNTFGEGSPSSEEGHGRDEDLRAVTLTHPYYIGRTEVTRAEYRRVMGLLPPEVVTYRGDDQLPVNFVSRDQAIEFCRRLSAMERQHYRLPTEAEWENACHAGTTTSFAGTGNVNDIAWYAGNSGRQLHPVGSKQPNNWGLYDMEGNVGEWCQDEYVGLWGHDPKTDPIETSKSQIIGVVRGGSCWETARFCRTAARTAINFKWHLSNCGFRVAMDATAARNSAIH